MPCGHLGSDIKPFSVFILTPMTGVPKKNSICKTGGRHFKTISHSYQDPSRKCLSIHLIKYILVVGGGRGRELTEAKEAKTH